MNRHLTTTLLLLLSASAIAGPPDCTADRRAVTSGLERLGAAMQAGDAKTALSLTHPALVRMAGGDASYMALVQKSLADLKSKGVVFGETTYGAPTKTYRAGAQYVCFVPREMMLTIQQAKGKAIGFFAAAHDGATGSTWKYVDGSGLAKNPELLQKLFPGIPSGVEFPPTRSERIQ